MTALSFHLMSMQYEGTSTKELFDMIDSLAAYRAEFSSKIINGPR